MKNIKKKEEDKKEEKIKKEFLKKRQNKQVMTAITLMIVMIFIIVAVPWIKQNFFDKFVYLNLDFQKTQLGKIIFYSTRIPVSDNKGNIIGTYSMNFRNNPKKLDYVETNIQKNLITFKKNKTVFITLNPNMKSCEDNSIALIAFSSFLRDFAQKNISSAVTDETYANKTSLNYVTCENSPKNTVIYLSSGNKTQIKKTNSNCYELTYKDCEVLQVTEKFMIIILDKYMSYFYRK